jgi:magnesium chelatase subunit I
MSSAPRIDTLGQLKAAIARGEVRRRPVRDEVRDNLAERLRRKEPLFPGIIGYDDTVVPQLVNAILARHHFILLGLRGQAKTRLLRALTTLLDEWLPVVPESEIHDDPIAPLSAFGQQRVTAEGDQMPIRWLPREVRYVEKLATPDVTMADMIGDIDPIKAARGNLQLGSELSMHFGLLPRANRGIFAINELPDLMGKIQVGLFNIMQEGDVQIKGYPIRLPLDVLLVFTANPEDYTARGKIITPLKDRIGSEIRTHYPLSIEHAIEITRQEAWEQRHPERTEPGGELYIPEFLREIVESIAVVAREDKKIDKRSGVSQRLPISCMENVISNAERRAIQSREKKIVPRVGDIYAALPSITGKFELEYEGELRGADSVAHELIRAAVGRVYDRYFSGDNVSQIVQWFELGGSLKISDNDAAAKVVEQIDAIQGLGELAARLIPKGLDGPEMLASAAEFVLDGLYAHRRLSRSEELGYEIEKKRKRETAEQELPGKGFRRSYN